MENTTISQFVSDNVEGDPVKIAQEAKKKGIRIYTIGIGTTEGELIRLPKEMQTDASPFLKDRSGNFVKTRLNETVLQQMSLLSLLSIHSSQQQNLQISQYIVTPQLLHGSFSQK